MTYVSRWCGQYFGWIDGGDLYTKDGRHIGRFKGAKVFSANGSYLGELRQQRLIVNPANADLKWIGFITPRVNVLGPRVKP